MPGASITFADAGTNLRVGIQDVSAVAGPAVRGDGTWDVYADLVGGTDTITTTTFLATAMETGTKTLSHNQLISIAIGTTTRAGTDTVKVRCMSCDIASNRPSVTLELATPSFGAQTAIPIAVIEFDDGTFGIIDESWITSTAALASTIQFSSSSTPDEYCLIFTPEAPFTVDALRALVDVNTGTADFELILYSDPEGTPAVIETLTIDSNQLTSLVARIIYDTLATPRELSAGVKYAVAIRPTTTNAIDIVTFNVAAAGHWLGHAFGANGYLGSRSNQTGAFTPDLLKRPMLGMRKSGSEAVGAGAGGLIRHPGMVGGLNA